MGRRSSRGGARRRRVRDTAPSVIPRSHQRILVAGLGSAWRCDDEFGSACARRLAEHALPPGADVMPLEADAIDLVYEATSGCDSIVLLDVSRRGGHPGRLDVLEPELSQYAGPIGDLSALDSHEVDPATVLRLLDTVGGFAGRVVVIACEPGDHADDGVDGTVGLVYAAVAGLLHARA